MNRKNLERMGAVIVPFENAEIEPCADDARDDAREHAVHQLAAVDVIALRGKMCVNQCENQSRGDYQTVPVHLKRADGKRHTVDGEFPAEIREADVKLVHPTPPRRGF